MTSANRRHRSPSTGGSYLRQGCGGGLGVTRIESHRRMSSWWKILILVGMVGWWIIQVLWCNAFGCAPATVVFWWLIQVLHMVAFVLFC